MEECQESKPIFSWGKESSTKNRIFLASGEVFIPCFDAGRVTPIVKEFLSIVTRPKKPMSHASWRRL